ncbi:MAG: TMEM175 family protein [Methylocella sp.]
MEKNRVEAFSDGVFGVVATLLVMDLRLPEGPSVWQDLLAIAPKILVFVLSFVIVTMYWVAHHSMFHFVSRVDRSLLWLNNLSLLCVSFIPFPTAVLGNHPLEPSAIALYGLTLILVNLMGTLTWSHAARNPELSGEHLTPHVAAGVKRLHLSPVAAYTVAIIAVRFQPWLSLAIFVLVPLFFIVPNRWVHGTMRSLAE